MNLPPVNSFTVIEHLHSVSMDRNIHGYQETSTIDIHYVLSQGISFYALTQREGDEVSCDFSIRSRGHLHIGPHLLKDAIELWRAAWLSGVEAVIPGDVGHLEFGSMVKTDYAASSHRIVVRGCRSSKVIGYMHWSKDERFVITYDENEACLFPSYEYASILHTGLLFRDQPQELRENVESILELFGEDITVQLQKEVGENGGSWVDVGDENLAPVYTRKNSYINKIKQY